MLGLLGEEFDMAEAEINPVVQLSSLALTPSRRGSGYQSARGRVARRIGLTKIGATYLEVPPGKSSCPYHVHHAEDEMFLILEGSGEYRFGERRLSVAAGDVLGAPCGGPAFAHKLTNTGSTTLKYLAISSKADTDVCEYPDSGKFSVGSKLPKGEFGFIGRLEDIRDYWDGEPD